MLDPTIPQSRAELADRLADLRQQGILDIAEETRLLDHYDAMVRDTEDEKARLEPEFERRRAEDGDEKAAAWLLEVATEIGRKQGAATRALTDQLRVVTG